MSSRGRALPLPPPPPPVGLKGSALLLSRPSRRVVGIWEEEMDEWARFAPAAKLLGERERDGGSGGLLLRDSASSCCRRAFALRRLMS